jgi:hypothetical protein
MLALLILILLPSSSNLLLARPAATSAHLSRQFILYIYDSSDPEDEELFAKTALTLHYARLNYDRLDLATPTTWPRLEQYSAVMFMTGSMHKINKGQVQQLFDYVIKGGGLVVAYRGWHPRLASLFGFSAGTQADFLTTEETGLHFVADFFPGVQGLSLDKRVVPLHTLLDLPPPLQTQLIAVADSGRPLVWLNRYGQGRTLFWNTDFLARRDARGFVVQSILSVQPVGVQPIANFATFQVDDFPAAVSTEKLEPIKSEYDLNMVDFYHQVWVPDMQEISGRYNIPYTFFLPFNYNALITPPFDFNEWEHATVTIDDQPMTYAVYVSQLLAQKHELGLHGYNHISLLVEPGYWISEQHQAAWTQAQAILANPNAADNAKAEAAAAITLMGQEAENNMTLALAEAARRWDKDNLGPWPLSYVPTNNIFHPAATKALLKTFPSLKIMAGLYFGEFEKGGLRDFGPEPWNPSFYTIPRVTAEYTLTSENRFLVISMLSLMGVMTHFVHPDDVFNTPQNYPLSDYQRNPNTLPWRGDHTGQKNGFYYHLVDWLDFNETFYPWLRYTRTDESLEILNTHLNNHVTVDLNQEGLTLTSDSLSYYLVRINSGQRLDLTALQGVQFLHVYQGQGYRLYALRGVKENISLKLLPPPAVEAGLSSPTTTLWTPSLPIDQNNILDLQGTTVWLPPPVPTAGPTSTPTPTATPSYDVLPMPTPTLRSRP